MNLIIVIRAQSSVVPLLFIFFCVFFFFFFYTRPFASDQAEEEAQKNCTLNSLKEEPCLFFAAKITIYINRLSQS